MSEATNERIARRWVEEVWNRGNESFIHEYLHPQAVGHIEGAPDVHGPAELIPQWKLLREAFPDMHIDIDELVAKGDDVVFRWTARGTHLGQSLGLPPSGRRCEFNGMTWMRFRDGQMVEGWDRWNQGAMLQQLSR